LGGNLTTSIAFGPTSFFILKVGWAKQVREFDYWVALPLPKLTLLFAIVSVAFVFALPGKETSNTQQPQTNNFLLARGLTLQMVEFANHCQ
jgi:hypothetical protein